MNDLKHIKYINKLFIRYKKDGQIKERLLLNHVIILNNLFGPFHMARILFLKCPDHHAQLKPVLDFLNVLPDVVPLINNTNITTAKIVSDQGIVECLKTI